MLKLAIHIIIIVLICGSSSGQSGFTHNYSFHPIEALESVTIETSFLDRLGVLWVISGTSILRLDGSQSDVISDDHGFNPNERVVKLCEDSNYNKFFLFEDRDYFGFMPYGRFELENIPISENEKIIDSYVDNHGATFLVSKGDEVGIYSYNVSENKSRFVFQTPVADKNLDIKILYTGSYYVLLNETKVQLFNKQGQLERIHDLNPGSKSYFYDSHPVMIKDDFGSIYFTIYNSGSIFKLSPEDDFSTIETLNIPGITPVIEGLWRDKNNNIIAAWKDTDGFTSISYLIEMGPNDTISKIHLPERTISDITGYNFNDFLIVCGYYGAEVLKRKNAMFRNFVSKAGLQSNYLEDGISMRGIAGDDTHIYAVREIENIYKLEKRTGEVEKKYIFSNEGDTLDFRCVRNAIMLNNEIWFSSCSERNDNYLIRYNIDNDRSTIYEAPGRIQSISLDHDSLGIILAMSRENEQSKLYNFNLVDREFGLIPYFLSNPNDEFTFIKDIPQGLFLGTKSGLRILDPFLFNLSTKFNDLQQFLRDTYISYIGSFENNIVIGTMDRGIIVYNYLNNEIKEINTKSGIASNDICGVLRDSKNRYWVSTFNGLYVLDEKFEVTYWFFENDGINHNEFNRFSYFKDKDTLYFGGVNGFLQINTQELQEEISGDSELFLSKINYEDTKLNRTVTNFYNGENPVLNLKPYQTNLKIKYTSPQLWKHDLIISVGNESETEWMLLGKTKSLDLSGIQPGNYNFISSLNTFKNQPENLLRQNIIVDQYFYKTNGFRILIFMMVIGAVILYFLNKRNEERKLILIRERIADDLHDNLGSILTRIASRAEISMLRNSDKNMKQEFDYFLANSNEALNLMRDSIWSVNPENDNLQDLIDRMKDFSYNSLNHRNIKIAFDINVQDGTKISNPLWRKEVYLIFKEAITNILKHSEASIVRISITQFGNNFKMMIINDGVLNHKISNGLGMGIESMKKRSQNLGAAIEFNNGNDEFLIAFNGKLD